MLNAPPYPTEIRSENSADVPTSAFIKKHGNIISFIMIQERIKKSGPEPCRNLYLEAHRWPHTRSPHSKKKPALGLIFCYSCLEF